MEFRRYDDVGAFSSDVLDLLLENELLNNLPISILTGTRDRYATGWLMATVVDKGMITHAALCTKPFNLLLCEAGNTRRGGSRQDGDRQDGVELLAREIRRLGVDPPGLLAERGLARRFADAYTGGRVTIGDNTGGHMAVIEKSLVVMRLDKLDGYEKAPGYCRTLTALDMYFVPYWERSFSEECRTNAFSISETAERISTRIIKNTHYIWEDQMPVSQAVNGRNTPNGAVINMVYTPPHFRGRGYATSVVAKLSGALLDSGKDFCCLFADAGNPVAQNLYRKLGYYDVYTFDDITFSNHL